MCVALLVMSVIGVSVNKEFWCEWGVCVVDGWCNVYGVLLYGNVEDHSIDI